MTDDEIYLACLLAIGPWDWKVDQTEFLMEQLNRKLGRRAALDEGMAFINGYRQYSRPEAKVTAVSNTLVTSIAQEAMDARIENHWAKELIDTHNVGK